MYNPSLSVYRRLLKALRIKFVGDRKTYLQFKTGFKGDILKYHSETDPIKISKIVFDFDIARE